MTLGARYAGIDVQFAVERCSVAAATYRQNFPNIDIYIGDIRDVDSLPEKPPEVKTIVFAGPPCQGFSTSNQRTRNTENPDNWLYRELIRVATIWEPDWIVVENVKGIRETLRGFFLTEIEASLQSAGYTTTTTSLNAVHYGVPQRRERTFVVGSKNGVVIADPPTLKRTPITVREAIEDLPELTAGASTDTLPYPRQATNEFAQSLRGALETVTGNLVTRNAQHVLARYPHVPQGGNWQDIPSDLMANHGARSKCHTGIYRRLTSVEPSVVIGNFRKNMLIHPHEDRGLSIREAARIQSVPDDFRFCGSIGFQQQQVGNMVPPRLARALFAQVANA